MVLSGGDPWIASLSYAGGVLARDVSLLAEIQRLATLVGLLGVKRGDQLLMRLG